MAAKNSDTFVATMESLSEVYNEYYEKDCPLDAFPEKIRAVAKTYAVARNLPMEYLCFCACGILSGAMGRVFKARNAMSGGYTQSANLYMLGVGHSSTGKSASVRVLYEPLEKTLIKARLKYQKDLEKWRKQQPSKDMFADDKQSEALDWNSELSDKPKKPKDPDFIVKNSTSEALVEAMQLSGGEIFSVCEEARDNLGIVAGNYKKQGDDTEVFNSGWSLEPIKHNRVIRGVSEILRPCVSALWMVQNDAIANIMAKNKDSFIGSGFSGRFIYFNGPSKLSKGSKEIIPLDEYAIAKWEDLLLATYAKRTRGGTIWFDADKAAFEYFWDFHSVNVDLMNGKLHSQAALLGKARENAIRLSIIFAEAEGLERITEDIAKRACKVIAYSVCNSVMLFSGGMLPVIEKDRAKMDSLLRAKNGIFKRISYFDQYANLNADRIEFLVKTFPDTYAILKKGKGRYVVLQSAIKEAKEQLDIADSDDDIF